MSTSYGVVSFTDVLVVVDIVWDATLAFIGIIILSMILDEIGFFEWAAIKMAKLSGGNRHKVFVSILLLGALVYANILGSNLGPKMTPISSLATLFWLHVLAQRGVKIGW